MKVPDPPPPLSQSKRWQTCFLSSYFVCPSPPPFSGKNVKHICLWSPSSPAFPTAIREGHRLKPPAPNPFPWSPLSKISNSNLETIDGWSFTLQCFENVPCSFDLLSLSDISLTYLLGYPIADQSFLNQLGHYANQQLWVQSRKLKGIRLASLFRVRQGLDCGTEHCCMLQAIVEQCVLLDLKTIGLWS